VSGHDFSRAEKSAKKNGALEWLHSLVKAANQPSSALCQGTGESRESAIKRFVTGHDFSRAEKNAKMNGALAPEEATAIV
jgi:hypothetical protein